MALVIPARQLIGQAMERFEAIAYPPRGRHSPVATGATPDEWAALAGIGASSTPCDLLASAPLDVGLHHPATIAHWALQRLTSRAVTERVYGLPMRYRPCGR